MTVVTNTSPIIVLAKIKKLHLLRELYGDVLMTPFVKVECIDRGKEMGAKDVVDIEKGIEEEWIKLTNLIKNQKRKANKLVRETRMGLGEAEAIILAKDNQVLALLDDKEARAVAKSLGLKYTSTVMVLYDAFVREIISYDELVEDLSNLTKVMWISTDVITEIIKKAKKVGG